MTGAVTGRIDDEKELWTLRIRGRPEGRVIQSDCRLRGDELQAHLRGRTGTLPCPEAGNRNCARPGPGTEPRL